MYIRSLDLKNFRNYKELSLEFNRGVNIFYGNNAQGKTNILEALYIAGTTKSHKGSKEKDIIRQGEEESHIRVDVARESDDLRIDVHLKKNKPKGIAVNKIPLRKARELFGLVNMVFFSPEDLNIIKNGPSARRKYINFELSQLSPVYFQYLGNYIKCLNQRNKLLKDISFNGKLKDELDVWDIQLVNSGKKVIEERRAFIDELKTVVKEVHGKITDGREELELIYEPDIKDSEFEEKLRENRDKDIRFQTTTSGPHRDDLGINVNGKDLRIFGSQGQVRSGAISLKLSEITMLREKTKETPVLLLDDVLSELDTQRQELLLSGTFGLQTMITCTGLDDFINSRCKADKVFHVVDGTVS